MKASQRAREMQGLEVWSKEGTANPASSSQASGSRPRAKVQPFQAVPLSPPRPGGPPVVKPTLKRSRATLPKGEGLNLSQPSPGGQPEEED